MLKRRLCDFDVQRVLKTEKKRNLPIIKKSLSVDFSIAGITNTGPNPVEVAGTALDINF